MLRLWWLICDRQTIEMLAFVPVHKIKIHWIENAMGIVNSNH
jgi:hypothetical protein